MAVNTGYDWGAWAYIKDSAGTDWDGDGAAAITDNDSEISNTAVSLDVIAACEVGIVLVEGNVGAIDGVVTVYVLGDGAGVAYEQITQGSPWSFTITPVQGSTVYKRFQVDPGSYGSFVFAMLNECGRTLTTSVKVRTATIPAAS